MQEIPPLYIQALQYAVENQSATITIFQRIFHIGYNKAGEIIEWMEAQGYIQPFSGAKSRKVLLTKEQFETLYGQNN